MPLTFVVCLGRWWRRTRSILARCRGALLATLWPSNLGRQRRYWGRGLDRTWTLRSSRLLARNDRRFFCEDVA
jgi:hypothetical protein